MTGLTFHCNVFVFKFVFGVFVMVKSRLFPIFGVVAILTFHAKFGFVYVVFLVTRHTIHGHFFKFLTGFMTAFALGSMFIAQWKLGFIVVKIRGVPSALIVTAFTFLAQRAFMHIICAVAANTCFW